MADIYGRMNLIMDSMYTVFTNLKHNSFIASKDISFEMALKRVKSFFALNSNEAALLSYIFVRYFKYNETPISIFYIAGDDFAAIRLLSFRDEFNSLEEKGFISSVPSEEPESEAKFYRIPKSVTEAVLKNDSNMLYKSLVKKDGSLKYPDEITEKELFYSDDIRYEIKNLYTYLEKESFDAIQERLVKQSMPKGVCIMLYGAPGTGKTETVMQIAKKTNRAVFYVDIGSIISQWVGGTEANLSVLFEKYDRLCKQSKARNEEIPILLFNEADAIFGRRLEPPTQGSEIDENHIQSLLLDYLEKQEGIVIATTNLAGNFDDAFERRFLFKIKFEKPDTEIKKKIWKNKVQYLNRKTVEHLAESYAFSGGEIDNIARKAVMKEVLTGRRSSVTELEKWCESEKLEKDKSRTIGFGK